jgi:hypothetical protein
MRRDIALGAQTIERFPHLVRLQRQYTQPGTTGSLPTPEFGKLASQIQEYPQSHAIIVYAE